MERIELQRHGIFINAYGVSTIILHNILNYKLIINDKEYKKAIDKLEIDTKANLIYTKIKKLKIEDLNIFFDRLLEWLK